MYIKKLNKYKTLNEASLAAIKLNIKSRRDYLKKYILDPRLVSNPEEKYTDFPGWNIFLGKVLVEK